MESVLIEVKQKFTSINQRFVVSHSRGCSGISDTIIYDPHFTNSATYVNGYFMYMQSPNQVRQKKEDVFYSNRFPLFVEAVSKIPNLKIEMVIGFHEPWLKMVMPFAFFAHGRFQKKSVLFILWEV